MERTPNPRLRHHLPRCRWPGCINPPYSKQMHVISRLQKNKFRSKINQCNELLSPKQRGNRSPEGKE